MHQREVAAVAAILLLAGCAAQAHLGKEDSDRIARSVQRFATAPKDKWVFTVVTETGSNRYVQFFAMDKSIGLDFPVDAAKSPSATGPYQDGQCFALAPALRVGLAMKRYLSAPEEARLLKYLDSRGIKWSHEYCLNEDSSGKPVGYVHRITGVYPRPATDVPDFVAGVFNEVYLIDPIAGIRIEEDR